MASVLTKDCLNAQCQWRHIQQQQVLSWQILVSKVPSDTHSLVENWIKLVIQYSHGTSKTCFLYTYTDLPANHGAMLQLFKLGTQHVLSFQIATIFSHVHLVFHGDFEMA